VSPIASGTGLWAYLRELVTVVFWLDTQVGHLPMSNDSPVSLGGTHSIVPCSCSVRRDQPSVYRISIFWAMMRNESKDDGPLMVELALSGCPIAEEGQGRLHHLGWRVCVTGRIRAR
jgi:hypothetical protein